MSGFERAYGSGSLISFFPERSEGVLLLSGGLTIHNLGDRVCFHEVMAPDEYKQFDKAVAQATQVRDVSGLADCTRVETRVV